jgi:hypothetical protein
MSGHVVVSSSRRARTAALLGATTALATVAALSAGSVGSAQAADWVPYSDTTSVVVPNSSNFRIDPVTIMDAAGRGTAVWVNRDDVSQLQYAQRSATSAADAWSGPQQLANDTDPTASVAGSPRLAVDSNGNVTAAWVWSKNGHSAVYVADKLPGAAAWSDAVSVSDPAEDAQDVQVATNADDTVTVAWTSTGQDKDQIQAVQRTAGSAWTGRPIKPVSADDVEAKEPHLAGGGHKFILGWTQRDAADNSSADLVESSQQVAGSNDWTQLTPHTTTADGDSIASDVAMDDAGDASIIWMETASPSRVFASISPNSENWASPRQLSASGQNATAPLLAVNPNGALLAAWSRVDNTGYSHVQVSRVNDLAHNEWTAGKTLDSSVQTTDGDAYPVDAVLDDEGNPTVLVGTDTGSSQAFRREVVSDESGTTEVWNKIENAQPATAVGLSRDDAGDVATYSMRMPEAGSPDVVERIFDNSGPVATMTHIAASYRTLTIHPAWSATDLWSGIAGYQLMVQSAPWNGTFGAFAPYGAHTTAPTGAFTGAKGRSYCLAVVPNDTAQNVGDQSTSTCTTFPLDDRSMTRSTHTVKRKVHGKVRRVAVKDWASASSSAAYSRTLTTSSRKGSSLTLRGVRAQTLQLHALGGKRNGSVTGYFNGARLGTWNLNRSKTTPLVITMRNFPAVSTGTLVLKVASSGKAVRIDGVGTLKSS